MARLREYKKGVRTQITKNFWSTEFDCKCSDPECKWTKIDLDHVEKLQKLREDLGESLEITSGYRCDKHNKRVGGASRSRHKEGDSSDLKAKTKSPETVAKAAEKIGFDGIGRYTTFTHLDSRGYKARWNFRK